MVRTMTTPQIVLSAAPGHDILALFEGTRLEAVAMDASALTAPVAKTSTNAWPMPRKGDVGLIRIIQVLKSAGGAIVSLGNTGRSGERGQDGFLALNRPVLVHGAQGLTPATLPAEGQSVLAQITRVAHGDKGPRLTGTIDLPGRLAMVRIQADEHSAGQVRASRHWDPSRAGAVIPRLEGLFSGLDRHCSITLRTAAREAASAVIETEAQTLLDQWREIHSRLKDGTTPRRLHAEDTGVEQILRDWLPATGAALTCDDAGLMRRVEGILDRFGLADRCTLERITGSGGAMAVMDLEDRIMALASPEVPLDAGGSLLIEPAAALTAIDVNGAGAEDLSRVNLTAADEIGRQIRLRDIGGHVVIDFAGLAGTAGSAALKRQVVEALERSLGRSWGRETTPVRLGKLSPFGTLELTRERSGEGVMDQGLGPCSACGAKGRVPSIEALSIIARGPAFLRTLQKAARGGRGGGGQGLRIRVGEALGAWLHQPQVAEALAGAGLTGVPVTPDPSLGPDTYKIEEMGNG